MAQNHHNWNTKYLSCPSYPPPEAKTVKQVVVTFLYYVCIVDPTMLLDLNIITAEQANRT